MTKWWYCLLNDSEIVYLNAAEREYINWNVQYLKLVLDLICVIKVFFFLDSLK